MQHIPYKGGAPAALAVATTSAVRDAVAARHLELRRGGKVRSLATGSLETRSDPAAPADPRAAGFPGFEAGQRLDLLTTRGTPRDVVAKINTAVNDVLKDPSSSRKQAAQGTTGRQHAGRVQGPDRDRNLQLEADRREGRHQGRELGVDLLTIRALGNLNAPSACHLSAEVAFEPSGHEPQIDGYWLKMTHSRHRGLDRHPILTPDWMGKVGVGTT